MRKLWLDLGNTRLKYWITQNDEIIDHFAELHLQSPSDLLLGLMPYLKQQAIQTIGISSVLDEKNNLKIEKTLKKLNIPVIFAQVHAHYAGVQCGYSNVEQLGIDRWLQILAVAEPNKNVCVVGCGTALTIDLISGMQHLGGYILPNLYLQRDSLIQNTKGIKIPDSAFENLDPGQNTVDCVHHGILLGLVSTIEKIMVQTPQVLVLTGGDANVFAHHLKAHQPIVQQDLLLKGLAKYVDHTST